MDPQTQSFFYIMIIDGVLVLVFVLIAFLIIQCKKNAKKISNLTTQNLLSMANTTHRGNRNKDSKGSGSSSDNSSNSSSSTHSKGMNGFEQAVQQSQVAKSENGITTSDPLTLNLIQPHPQQKEDLILQKYRRRSLFRIFFTIPWTVNDNELFNMAPDIDTYIYLVFLKMSVRFFTLLSVLNGVILMPLYSSGSAQAHLYETILPQIQRVSIANVIGDSPRLTGAFAMGCLNWIALCVFIYLFKRKVDAVSDMYSINKYEDEDVMIAGQSIMLENIPRDIKLHNAEHHTKALFQELCQTERGAGTHVVKVKVVPDFSQLNQLVEKRKELKSQLDHYKILNKTGNSRQQIKIRKNGSSICCCPGLKNQKLVDAADYYDYKIKRITEDINRVKLIEHKSSGTAFVLFESQESCELAMSKFKDLQASDNAFWNKYMKINSWKIRQAPAKFDIIWSNLALTPKTRQNRKNLVIALIALLAILVVLPVAFIEKIIAIQPVDFDFQHTDFPFISDILNQNRLLTLISAYFSPLVLYFSLYLFLPAVIVQFSHSSTCESNILVTKKEQNVQNKKFFTMILSNLIVTGLEMMIIGQFIYFFVDLNSEQRMEYAKEMRMTNFAFKILPQLDFFARFFIQLIFVSASIQIFTAHIKRKTIMYENKPEARQKKRRPDQNYIVWFFKRIVHFEEWYFSFDYQIPFIFSMFTLTILLSNALPIILPLGALFFGTKLYIEFKERILYQHLNEVALPNLSASKASKDRQPLEANHLESMITYLLVPVVLYFGVSAVFYSAQPKGHHTLAIIQYILFAIVMFGAWRFRKAWDKQNQERERKQREKALRDGRHALFSHDNEMDGPGALTMSTVLDKFYRHPLESKFPIPKEKVTFSKRAQKSMKLSPTSTIITSDIQDDLLKMSPETRKRQIQQQIKEFNHSLNGINVPLLDQDQSPIGHTRKFISEFQGKDQDFNPSLNSYID